MASRPHAEDATTVENLILKHQASCAKEGGIAQVQTDLKEIRGGLNRLTTRTDRWSGAIVLALALLSMAAYYSGTVIRSIVREEIQQAIGKPTGTAHALR